MQRHPVVYPGQAAMFQVARSRRSTRAKRSGGGTPGPPTHSQQALVCPKMLARVPAAPAALSTLHEVAFQDAKIPRSVAGTCGNPPTHQSSPSWSTARTEHGIYSDRQPYSFCWSESAEPPCWKLSFSRGANRMFLFKVVQGGKLREFYAPRPEGLMSDSCRRQHRSVADLVATL